MAFSDDLKAACADDWQTAVHHRFCRELVTGRIDDAVMARYLVQDHRFIDRFLALLGAAIATADRFESRITLGRFVGVIAGEENTYFLRAFKALGVDERTRLETPDLAPTQGFKALMREAAESRSYAVALSVLTVAEWIYLDWAQIGRREQGGALPPSFVHAEWITLHDDPGFVEFVSFLRRELDRVGPAEAEAAKSFFSRAVALERAFFDSAYA